MNFKKKLSVIDCTLRDGGYYNNWKFNLRDTQKYINNCFKSRINYVELGFLYPLKKPKLGPNAYCRETYLKKLKIPKKLNLCFMINASDFYKNELSIKNELSEYMLNKFSLVRIAVNFKEIKIAKKLAKILKSKKLKIALNLMQSHEKNSFKIKKVINEIKSWKLIDCVYFADSIGSMDPEYVKYFCKILKKYWSKDYGFHAHNNKSYALINALSAINSGAKFIDSTVLGMGRGAGNVCTENLLEELKKLNYNYDPKPIAKNLNYFENLKKKYNWGPNIFYHYAANNNIHPTYVQKILMSKKFRSDHILNLLYKLKLKDKKTFKSDILKKLIH